MESKTLVKFSHIIVFFLVLATSFETLKAQSERVKLRDGLEVIQLPSEMKQDLGCKGKQRWPELIGVPAKLAQETVEEDNVLVQKIEIIESGSPIPLDFSCFRVRLVVNVLNIVVQIPTVG